MIKSETIQHAMGTLAAKSLGGPVEVRYVKSALKTLLAAGLIPRIGMSADEAFRGASINLEKIPNSK